MSALATFTLAHGTLNVISFEKIERSVWRVERFIPEDGSAPSEERRRALHWQDLTPPQGPYASACGCCYLNIAHTEALHGERLGPLSRRW